MRLLDVEILEMQSSGEEILSVGGKYVICLTKRMLFGPSSFGEKYSSNWVFNSDEICGLLIPPKRIKGINPISRLLKKVIRYFAKKLGIVNNYRFC